MGNNNKKKSEQLGMSHGTATGRLKKMIMWAYVIKNDDNVCHQCGLEIENIDHLSIEHIVPWLDSEDPQGLFFDLDNIAFSHLKCNIGNTRARIPEYFSLICDHCGKKFNRLARRVRDKRKIQTKFYCCTRCSNMAR